MPALTSLHLSSDKGPENMAKTFFKVQNSRLRFIESNSTRSRFLDIPFEFHRWIYRESLCFDGIHLGARPMVLLTRPRCLERPHILPVKKRSPSPSEQYHQGIMELGREDPLHHISVDHSQYSDQARPLTSLMQIIGVLLACK